MVQARFATSSREDVEMDKPPEESDELKKLAMQASIAIGQENHAMALKLADDIEALPAEPRKEIVLSGIWIDAGAALADESVVRRGIELLEKHIREYESKDKKASDKLMLSAIANSTERNGSLIRCQGCQYLPEMLMTIFSPC